MEGVDVFGVTMLGCRRHHLLRLLEAGVMYGGSEEGGRSENEDFGDGPEFVGRLGGGGLVWEEGKRRGERYGMGWIGMRRRRRI